MMLGLILLLFLKFGISQNAWNGIKPFHSHRLDVERLLGTPENPCSESCFYAQPNERVFIRFAQETCAQKGSWNVPKDTVIAISVYPSKTVTLSDLNLNTRKLRKSKDPELKGYYSYEDDVSGVSYNFSERNELISTDWFGTASDDKKFRCQ